MRHSSLFESLESRRLLSAGTVVQPLETENSSKGEAVETADADNVQQGPQNGSDGENVGGTDSGAGTTTTAAVTTSTGAPAHHKHAVHLQGSVAGTYTKTSQPDRGTTYHFTGSGVVRPLGAATVTGNITTPGNIASGFATGTLTITGPKGTLTLSVKGPREKGFGPLPSNFSFAVTSGTGSYAGAKGGGHLSLHLAAHGSTFTLKFN